MSITITSKRGMTPWATCHTHAAAEAEARKARQMGLDGDQIAETTEYTVGTDGCEATVEAVSMDDAAVQFARGEGIRGVTDAASLIAACERMGGWAWVEPAGEPSLRVGHRPA